MNRNQKVSLAVAILHHVWVVGGAAVLTLALFLILPVMQTISARKSNDLTTRQMNVHDFEEQEEIIEEEIPEEEPEPEPEEIEFEEIPQVDLSTLTLALDPGVGGSGFGGPQIDFDLNKFTGGAEAMEELFSLADLDQKPRAIYRPHPIQSAKTRAKAPGKVIVVFDVDERGKVQNPKILSASDPVFERPSMNAVKKWKFEPGKKNGKPVPFRMRSPITFPKG